MVTLCRTINAIGPMQAGVKPLGRVRRAHLAGQHGAMFVVKGAGISFGVEILAFPAPIGPGTGEAVEHLLGRTFSGDPVFVGNACECLFVHDGAPQPRWHSFFFYFLEGLWNSGLAEIFLRQNIRGHL